jgi:hypothetical protein
VELEFDLDGEGVLGWAAAIGCYSVKSYDSDFAIGIAKH